MNDSQMSETQQSPALKHYYKNKANVLDYYHKYYQLNKEKIKLQRRERYANQKLQKALSAEE
jgi:hypothetical protein